MGCCGGCAKAILIILNIIVMLLGLALTAVGAVVLAGGDLIKTAINAVIVALPDITDSFKFADGSGGTPNTDEAAESIIAFLKDIAVPLLIIGIILTVITFCGMCGACCNSKCLLIVYITCLVIITFALIIILPLYATGKLDPQIKSFLTTSVKQNYEKIDKFKALNLAWTVMMVELECCGADTYMDFYTDSVWERNRTVEISGTYTTVQLLAPFACCKMDSGKMPLFPETCARTPSDTNSNWKTGCFDKMKEQLGKYDVYVIGGMSGIIVFLILLIVFAVVIIKSNDDDKIV